MRLLPTRRASLLALAAAALVTACGGGSDGPIGPRAQIGRLVVAGDSLSDVGVFGFKFTVQNAADPAAGFPVFPEIVASSYGLGRQCNFYRATSQTSVAPNATAGCTNFAVGGGRILNAGAGAGTFDEQRVGTQLQAAAAAVGTWGANDLVLVASGSNDLADLSRAFVAVLTGQPGAVGNYQAFLQQQLDAATVTALSAQGQTGLATAGGLYMQRLARTYLDTAKAATLDRGAPRLAIADTVDITLTPAFRNVLGLVANVAGAAASDQLRTVIRQWNGAFNTELARLAAGDRRIAVVPLGADFTELVNNASAYALANTTAPVCPATGTNAFNLPTYTVSSCTSASLDAAPPVGQAAGWWRNWTFSDDFHPTPYVHQQTAASVNRALARAGWL